MAKQLCPYADFTAAYMVCGWRDARIAELEAKLAKWKAWAFS